MKILETVFETRIDVPYTSEQEYVEDGELTLENKLFINVDDANDYLNKDHHEEVRHLEYNEESRLNDELEIYIESDIDRAEKEVITYSVNQLSDHQIEEFLKDNPKFELKTSTMTIDDKTFEKKVFVEKESA